MKRMKITFKSFAAVALVVALTISGVPITEGGSRAFVVEVEASGGPAVEGYQPLAISQPTITTTTGSNSHMVRIRTEFLSYVSTSRSFNYLRFNGRVYTAEEFFDAYNGQAFQFGNASGGIVNVQLRPEVISRPRVRYIFSLPPVVLTPPPVVAPPVATPTTPTTPSERPNGFSEWTDRISRVLLSDTQLSEMIENAPSVASTRSAIIHPQRRMNSNEIATWGEDYWNLGGPNAFELEVVRLVNIERAYAGLHPLEICPRLMKAARFKTQNMVDLRYGGHHNPIYTNSPNCYSPGIMAQLFGVGPGVAENLADRLHYHEAHIAMDVWMRSPGHSANILDRNAVTIGIGALENPNTPHHRLGNITVTAKFGLSW